MQPGVRGQLTRVGGLLVTCLALTSLFLAGCARANALDAHPLATSLGLASDSDTLALAESILNGYESLHPGLTLTLSHESRTSALAAVTAGEVDAVLLLHPLERSELFHVPIAREMIVIAAHPDVPIESLTRRDVRALFSGQVAAWPAAAGDTPLPVKVVTRERGSSARLAFDTLIMQGVGVTASARLAADGEHMRQLVIETPGAVGYVTYEGLGEGILPLNYEGAPPTPDNARHNTYRLVTTVEFVSRAEPEGALRALLDWILSDEGQVVVRRHMLGLND